VLCLKNTKDRHFEISSWSSSLARLIPASD
jgi:hypothetical protein